MFNRQIHNKVIKLLNIKISYIYTYKVMFFTIYVST